MNDTKASYGVPAPVGRVLRLLLSTALLWSETASSWSARDLWSDRRRAANAVRAFPASSPMESRWRRLAASFPSLEKSLPIEGFPSSQSELPGWLSSTVGLYADVGESHLPARGEKRVLIHVLDLHEVEEAQRNTAAVLEQLSVALGGEKGLLVGLEGASGAFRIDHFRAMAPPSVRRGAADRLLKAGLISGPEYLGLTTETPIRWWGVEDARSYAANVRALTDTFPFQANDDGTVARAMANVERLKEKVYPDSLKELEQARVLHEGGRIGLASYVHGLAEGMPADSLGPTLRLFLDAVAREGDLSPARVAEDQARLLEALAPQLSEEESSRLMAAGLAQRWGRTPFSRFHRVLQSTCDRHGIRWTDYPHLQAYAAYSVRAEGIDPARLFHEIEFLAERRTRSLLTTPVLLELAEMDEEIRLVDKLNRFVLTPEEDRRLRGLRSLVDRWPERGAALAKNAGVQIGEWGALAPVVDRHIGFYDQAEVRNGPLVQNLIPRWSSDSPAVLVAGGYHAQGIRAEALARGLGYISLVPRVSSLDHLPPPLDSFRQPPRREWVFRGDQALHAPLQTASAPPGFVAVVAGVVLGLLALPLFDGDGPVAASAVRRASLSVEQIAVAAQPLGLELAYGGLTLRRRDEVGKKALEIFLLVKNPSSGIARIETVLAPSLGGNVNADSLTVRLISPTPWATLGARLGVYEGRSWFASAFNNQWNRVTVIASRLSFHLGQATRDTAVVLVRGLQWAGTLFRMELVAARFNRWRLVLDRSQERVYLERLVLPLSPEQRYPLLARLAAAHSLPMNEDWSRTISEVVNVARGWTVAKPSSSEGEYLRVSRLLGATSVSVRFYPSDARVLSEWISPDSLLQLTRAPDGGFDVYLQLPALSTDVVLRKVVARALREIDARSVGKDVATAHAEALNRREELENLRYLRLRLLRVDAIDNVVAVEQGGPVRLAEVDPLGEEMVFAGVTKPLPFISGGSLWAPALSDQGAGLGLAPFVMGAVPKGLSESGAIGFLEDVLAELDRLAEFMSVRNDGLSAWPWSPKKQRLFDLSVDLAVTFLSSAGRGEGKRAAVLAGGSAPPGFGWVREMANDSVFRRFYPLAQTLLGLWSAIGVPLEKHDKAVLDQLVSDMLSIYLGRFMEGVLQIRSIPFSLDQIVAASPGTAQSLSAGVFDVTGDLESSFQGETLLKILMGRTQPENFRAMVLVEANAEANVRESLVARLEREFPDSEKRDRVKQFLQSDFGFFTVVPLDRVRVGKIVSMAAVLNEVRSVWKERVGWVNVFTSDAGRFSLDEREALISWALFENLTLVSQSMAEEVHRRVIEAIVKRQA